MATYNDIFINGSNTFQFKRELAMAIGRDEAIVVNQIEYWLSVFRQQDDKERHFRDGRWWVWNTMNAWVDHFGIYSYNTLNTVFNKLRDRGILLVSNQYNREVFDRTYWYTIDYDRLGAIYAEYWEGKDRAKSPKSKKGSRKKVVKEVSQPENEPYPISQNLGNAVPNIREDNTIYYSTKITHNNINAVASPSRAIVSFSTNFDVSLKKSLENMKQVVKDQKDYEAMKYLVEYFFSAVALRTDTIHHVLSKPQCKKIYTVLSDKYMYLDKCVEEVTWQIQGYLHDFIAKTDKLTMEHFASEGILTLGDYRLQYPEIEEEGIDYRAYYIDRHPDCLMAQEANKQVLAPAT